MTFSFDGPLKKIGSLSDANAEITAFDGETGRLFTVSGDSTFQIIDLQNPESPTLVDTVDLSGFGDGANSIAVKNGVVAIALEAEDGNDPGTVAFFGTDGSFLSDGQVGVLPDMLTLTPDGSKVLVANEGEPTDEGDPLGSVSIIDLSKGVDLLTQGDVTTLDFTGFDGREAEFKAKGVRIFPDKPISEDLEPEFISVSPDGTTAWVTLQENNAVAIVNLDNNEIEDLLPLGVQDHSVGQPRLETFELSDLPVLGTTAGGQDILLGGLSGLFYEGTDPSTGNLKFVTVPDRGPNGEPTDVDADGEDERPFALPDYQAQIIRFELNPTTGELTLHDPILLTRNDGAIPITGRPNIAGVDEEPVDLNGNPLSLDPFGADMEGIVVAEDGSFWTVDEYRPAIYNFDASGDLIKRYVPEGTAALADRSPGDFGTETLPFEYSNRRGNRGFEAIAYNSDTETIYAFIQTPLANPDRDASDASDVIRILGIDMTTGAATEKYVYLLEDSDIRSGGRVDKIGDAVYNPETGTFFVIERDSDVGPTAKKFIFEIDLTGATNLVEFNAPDALPAGETLEQQSAEELAALGIQPVNKVKVTNLPSIGYDVGDKPEGLALLEDGRLAVLNDNDFGLLDKEIPIDGTVPLNPAPTPIVLGLIDLGTNNGLDASDKDDEINIQNQPLFGLRQPDAIASFEVDGATYFITANEGDARDEDERIEDLTLDPTAFPDAETLQAEENLGRIQVSTIDGDLDQDGDFDQLFSYGARSFTIYDSVGNVVFDSGDQFEQILADLTPDLFNANFEDDDLSDPPTPEEFSDDSELFEFDGRSDNKGPEPESVIVETIGDRIYAFVGLERAGGGVVVYDVTDPVDPEFIQYSRSEGDVAPEGLTFVPASDSPNGRNMLIVSNEVSNTIGVFDFVPPDLSTPEAEADDYTVSIFDAPLVVSADKGVLQNDSDEDGDSLSAVLETSTEQGKLTLNTDGSFDYIPNFGFVGTDSFSYSASDGTSASTTTVTITVDFLPESSVSPIEGTQQSETLNGTQQNDVIVGFGGNDRIFARRGEDTLDGGEGMDSISGLSGNDILDGGAGKDILRGGSGSDAIFGNGGNDFIKGQKGDDLILGGDGSDILQGNSGDDLLFGGNGFDHLRGGGGADLFILSPGTGLDRIADFRLGVDQLGLVNGITFDTLSFESSGSVTKLLFEDDAIAVVRSIGNLPLASASNFIEF